MITSEFNIAAQLYSPYGVIAAKAPGKTCIWIKPTPEAIASNYGGIMVDDMPLIYRTGAVTDAKINYLRVKIVDVLVDNTGLHAWTNDLVLPKLFDGINYLLDINVSNAFALDQSPTDIGYELSNGQWIAAPLTSPINRTLFFWPASHNVRFVDTTTTDFDLDNVTGGLPKVEPTPQTRFTPPVPPSISVPEIVKPVEVAVIPSGNPGANAVVSPVLVPETSNPNPGAKVLPLGLLNSVPPPESMQPVNSIAPPPESYTFQLNNSAPPTESQKVSGINNSVPPPESQVKTKVDEPVNIAGDVKTSSNTLKTGVVLIVIVIVILKLLKIW